MQVAEVLEVLADLCGAGCRIWVAGGWGVDALVGHQTRPHRDMDLAVDADHEAAAIATLERRGYHIETDWLPVRMELAAPDRGWVDLHPVVFDSSGHGRQAERWPLRLPIRRVRPRDPWRNVNAVSLSDTSSPISPRVRAAAS